MKFFYILAIFLFFSVCYCGNNKNNNNSTDAWPIHGRDLHNSRYLENEYLFADNAHLIENAWNYTANGDISATPSVDSQGNLYLCDSGGYLFSLNGRTGRRRWRVKLGDYSGIANDFCRATPAINERHNALFVGSRRSGQYYKFDMQGNFKKKLVLNDHKYAIITGGATIYRGRVYIGVSSDEPAPEYVAECCSFRGSFHSIDIETFEIVWTQYTFPEKYLSMGVSGCPIWGSSPTIDQKRGLVLVGTGSAYTLNIDWQLCAKNAIENNLSLEDCVPKDIYYDSVVAFNIRDGSIAWANRLVDYEAALDSCRLNIIYNLTLPCPLVQSGDNYDFGTCPILIRKERLVDDYLVISGKNGAVYKLNATDGSIISFIQAGPPGEFGGNSFGGASDGIHYFGGQFNTFNIEVPVGPPSNIPAFKYGYWTKIRLSDFSMRCQIAVPNIDTVLPASGPYGPSTVVNDLWIGTTPSITGPQVHLINARTCEIIKSFQVVSEVGGGASVYKNCIYVGTGYQVQFQKFVPELNYTHQHTFYAFCLRERHNNGGYDDNYGYKGNHNNGGNHHGNNGHYDNHHDHHDNHHDSHYDSHHDDHHDDHHDNHHDHHDNHHDSHYDSHHDDHHDNHHNHHDNHNSHYDNHHDDHHDNHYDHHDNHHDHDEDFFDVFDDFQKKKK